MQPWGQSPKSTSPSNNFRPELAWSVNLPEYVYNNGANAHPNEMHNEIHPPHNYHQQADMSRRHEHFTYSQGQPNADPPQHHPNTVPQVPQVPQVQQVQQVQPPAPLNVPPPQPPSQPAPPSTQQSQPPHPAQAPPVTPTTTTATNGGRQRKRPAPGSANATQAGTAAAQNQASAAPSAHMAAAAATPASASDTPGISAPAASQANPPATATDDSAPPPPKKSRTNTPWTPEEEHRLKAMRDEGKSWADIAKTFPTRTEGSVKKHWYKDMHYAEFGQDESDQLLQAIKEYEANKWKVIGNKLGKPAKACEQYAKEHFPQLFPNSNKR